MPETVTIAANAVTAKLHEASREVKLAVQQTLSYAVAGAEQTLLFKQHRWDGRSSFLDFKTGTFPAGFLHFVAANLRRQGYETRIVRKPFPEPLGPEKPVIDAFPEDRSCCFPPASFKHRLQLCIALSLASRNVGQPLRFLALRQVKLPNVAGAHL